MSLSIASFAVAALGLSVAIMSFIFGDKDRPRARLLLGIPFFLLALLFVFIGFSSLLGSAAPAGTEPGQPSAPAAAEASPTVRISSVPHWPPASDAGGTMEASPTARVPASPSPTPFKRQFEVFANLPWQNTGVEVASTDILRVVWDGKSKWRGTDSGEFSDPLGGWVDTTAFHYACPPLMEPERAGWNALVARIGETGEPFNPFRAVLKGDGTLYLAMNDCDSERYDNEGSVVVTLEVYR